MKKQKYIKATCIGCSLNNTRDFTWCDSSKQMIELIKSQINGQGKRCFPDKDIKILEYKI